MPRRGRGDDVPAARAQRQSIWADYGKIQQPDLSSWDPKSEQLVEALLTIAESGATVVLRPGSGGRSIGIAIWEGDDRHPPAWLYTSAEVDDWSHAVLEKVREQEAAD